MAVNITNSSKSNINSSVDDVLFNKKLFFIDTIAKHCDKCGSPYVPDDLNIIQENGLATIIHFSCSKCKASHIANFVMPIGLASRVPVNTDLNPNEVLFFAKQDKVSIDDVLVLYEVLENVKKVSSTD
jgi:hypothetical protein